LGGIVAQADLPVMQEPGERLQQLSMPSIAWATSLRREKLGRSRRIQLSSSSTNGVLSRWRRASRSVGG
jgi:hypothetical protein